MLMFIISLLVQIFSNKIKFKCKKTKKINVKKKRNEYKIKINYSHSNTKHKRSASQNSRISQSSVASRINRRNSISKKCSKSTHYKYSSKINDKSNKKVEIPRPKM